MAQSDTSLVQLASMKEASYAVVPGTVVLMEKRATSVQLRYNKNTVRSAEIRSDRQVPDLIEVGADAAGETGFELSFGAYDDWLLSALMATDTDWTTPYDFTGPGTTGTPGDIEFAAPSTINSATAAFGTLRVGQYIRITGATNPANNGIFKLATVAATIVTVVETTLADEDGSTARIRGSMIRNGVTAHSFLLERKFSDIDEYEAFPGMMVDQLAMTTAADSILNGRFTWLGQKVLTASATLDTAGGYDAATTADVYNATSNVGSILKNGAALATYLQAIELQLANNLRNRRAIGSKFAISVGKGTLNITGTLRAYFEDLVLRDHGIDHDAVSLHWRVTDAAGNAMLFTLPRVKNSGGDPDVPGINQDVILPWAFEAIRDPTTNCMVQIDKLAA